MDRADYVAALLRAFHERREILAEKYGKRLAFEDYRETMGRVSEVDLGIEAIHELANRANKQEGGSDDESE